MLVLTAFYTSFFAILRVAIIAKTLLGISSVAEAGNNIDNVETKSQDKESFPPFCAMPGKWSAASIERRRVRAIERGYITSRSSSAAACVQVSPEVAPRARAIAKSLDLSVGTTC